MILSDHPADVEALAETVRELTHGPECCCFGASNRDECLRSRIVGTAAALVFAIDIGAQLDGYVRRLRRALAEYEPHLLPEASR